ncbi:cytochrome c oxidase subunit 5B, mitochondrial-like [Diadema setosum]|uniref:cytochrome c oxidase subunit 5B, mitochondrial-like n=1 Tax=Diadema antillarum TaxID=105358 RepID=UPI003A88D6B9
MASLTLRKCAFVAARKSLLRPSVRAMASGGGIPENFEHATGLEKKELERLKAGDSDPFQLNVRRVAAGTKTKPVEVTSAFTKRIVGCICEEEQTHINWMWLYAGEPQRCECGHWFQLKEVEGIAAAH